MLNHTRVFLYEALASILQHLTSPWWRRSECGVRRVGTSPNIWLHPEEVRWSHQHHRHLHHGRWSEVWRILPQSLQRRWSRWACQRYIQLHGWLRRAEAGCRSPWPRRRHGTPTGSSRRRYAGRERRSWIYNALAPDKQKHNCQLTNFFIRVIVKLVPQLAKRFTVKGTYPHSNSSWSEQ